MTELFLFSVPKKREAVFVWTEDERRILTENHLETLETLMTLLPKRSRNAILRKAIRMGVWEKNWAKPRVLPSPIFMEEDTNKERLQYRIQQLQYFAGYFDGEGCVCISKEKSKPDRKSPCYSLVLGLAATDRKVVEDFYNFFGVGWLTVSLLHKNFKVSKRIWSFHWGVQGEKAIQVLVLLLPFLRLKRKQVLLAIDFQEKKITRARELAESDLAFREKYRREMSILNRSPRL